jgi:hypothetical protein
MHLLGFGVGDKANKDSIRYTFNDGTNASKKQVKKKIFKSILVYKTRSLSFYKVVDLRLHYSRNIL